MLFGCDWTTQSIRLSPQWHARSHWFRSKDSIVDSNVDNSVYAHVKGVLRPIFQMTSFAPTQDSDDLLKSRGYRFCDTSLVMTRSLTGLADAPVPSYAEDAAAWLQVLSESSGKCGTDQAVHMKILRRIRAPRARTVHSKGFPSLTCGLGMLVGEKVGLFDIAIRQDHQRRGLARRLCGGLLGWGARQDAQTAFLQMVESNLPAISLYEQLRSKIAYRYWYRVPNC